MAAIPYAGSPKHADRLTASYAFSHETVFADLRLAAMKREREPSSKAYRQDRFENTERAAKETIEAEQRARREKTKRLKELRLSQQGAKDPAIK
ncbi:hypothetical protein GR223_25165 [Rhizobium leguminosarum]|uniref:hypothetical protein n=1 Tax=Rhizobium ruizarguesonis TaxID=2081791 RepID=UPI0010319419|nr:hypothetical protein [Rhizobium ruizarguesonis]NEJ89186.1 hypothetical protein [Rhizobium ruizarguesonis]TAT84369.1 hypothetical protein ELI52_13175 [Rhizobium ruizarguesonis]TAU32021.1 hypothetical protein ELI47_13540 [Rhizobium ruizarguesonis]TAW22183.1 hypothetical protein ELI20_13745 [Rhizobium ruizarguesonis]